MVDRDDVFTLFQSERLIGVFGSEDLATAEAERRVGKKLDWAMYGIDGLSVKHGVSLWTVYRCRVYTKDRRAKGDQ